MSSIMISRLLEQANKVDSNNVRSSPNVKYTAIFISPVGNIKTLGVDGKADYSDFVSEHSEDMTISVRMQPSTYVNYIIPYRDNITVQLISTDGHTNVVKEYTAIPLDAGDPKLAGEHSATANIEGISANAIASYQFQLLDPTFALLRDQVVSGIVTMGNIEDSLSYILDTYTKQYASDLPYQGLVMESPVDNTNNYSVIVIPEGTPLINYPTFLQNSDKYGVYSKGLGCFFKQYRWWVYSLYDYNRYEKHPKPVNIFRFPKDKVPTLENTFFINESGLTILSNGDAQYDDTGDIDKQDTGVGSRLILSTRITGESGSYYNAGRSISTRADSMAEFQNSERANGNNFTPVRKTPTSNPFKYSSATSIAEGTTLILEWQNSDTGYIEPGVPCRYQYMDGDTMSVRYGIILGYRTDYKVMEANSLLMKRSTKLIIFLK